MRERRERNVRQRGRKGGRERQTRGCEREARCRGLEKIEDGAEALIHKEEEDKATILEVRVTMEVATSCQNQGFNYLIFVQNLR